MGNQAHRPALILIRHGKPAIVPDLPRSLWALSDEGRAAAAMAEVLGLSVRTDADLAEHRADDNPFVSQGEIESLIEQALREPAGSCWGRRPAQRPESVSPGP